MTKPLISIIIPTYNRLLILGELMESLSRQTLQDFEVIIVNDCGEKVDIVKELYPELTIRIIDLEKNSKHVEARNKGLMHASGEYIMLIDDDDLLVPTHIETMVKEIHGVDFAYSDVEIVNFENQHLVRVPKERCLFAYEWDAAFLRKFNTVVSSGCLYRRNLHEKIGLFDTEVKHYWDWDFVLRVADSFSIKRVPVAGVLYNFSDASNNESKNLESMRPYLDKLSEKHKLGYLPTKNFFLMLEEPEVKQREAESKIVWDGKPFVSRLTAINRKS